MVRLRPPRVRAPRGRREAVGLVGRRQSDPDLGVRTADREHLTTGLHVASILTLPSTGPDTGSRKPKTSP